jgi:NIPSNAP
MEDRDETAEFPLPNRLLIESRRTIHGGLMIYELRVYTVYPERMEALKARFRNHTCDFFERHGMKNVGYWTNVIGGRTDQLVYIIGHDDLGARERSWAAFAADPDWLKVKADSEADGGPIVRYIENQILAPTDFSPAQ